MHCVIDAVRTRRLNDPAYRAIAAAVAFAAATRLPVKHDAPVDPDRHDASDPATSGTSVQKLVLSETVPAGAVGAL